MIEWKDDFTKEEYLQIQERREEIEKLLKNAIEEYIYNDALCYEDGDFPYRRLLSGNYYISEESYSKSEDNLNINYEILLSIRMTSIENKKEQDYLGLDFLLEFVNINGEIEIEVLTHSSI